MNNIRLSLPTRNQFKLPTFTTPVPPCPVENEWAQKVYYWSMDAKTPITIAVVYFVSVHIINHLVIQRQQAKYKQSGKTEKISNKKLPAAPLWIAKTWFFKLLVILHNVFLCVYSVWTFICMFDIVKTQASNYFYHACSCNIFSQSGINLTYLGWLFYLSKFYEVLDTIIILMKGKPSSLLQSYHHSGAMMCMWSGIRYQAPPIWIFVLFNSFIHSLMYAYFTVSCLKIRVPIIVKRVLTSLQITQFIVGGSLAIFHITIQYFDGIGSWTDCVSTPDQALSTLINVGYLAPLTMLFGKFYIESYLKKSKKA